MNAADPSTREHVKALETVRKAKNAFLLLTILGPATHIAGWGFIEFGEVLESDIAVAEIESRQGQEPGAQLEHRLSAQQWRTILSGAMPLAAFVGRVGVVLYGSALLLGVLICLCGRVPGISNFIAAFFIAVLVGVFFIPWERLTPPESNVYGAFTTVDALQQRYAAIRNMSTTDSVSLVGLPLRVSSKHWQTVLDGLRFAVMPLLTMLLLAISGNRFSRGLAAAGRAAPPAEIPMRIT